MTVANNRKNSGNIFVLAKLSIWDAISCASLSGICRGGAGGRNGKGKNRRIYEGKTEGDKKDIETIVILVLLKKRPIRVQALE